MRNSNERRLELLESRNAPSAPIVLIRVIVRPDNSLSPVDRYESKDRQLSFVRAIGEGVAEFVDRVRNEASRVALQGPIVLVPKITSVAAMKPVAQK
jgi:hypothetical protein